jgi:hypothetical protein
MGDQTLLTSFEAGRLAANEFGHREHVRVAFLYLRSSEDFGAAGARFRAALRAFTVTHGVPQKFHETLTWAWLALVREKMEGHRDLTSEALLARCPELARADALSSVYDLAALIADPLARQVFVLPRRP